MTMINKAKKPNMYESIPNRDLSQSDISIQIDPKEVSITLNGKKMTLTKRTATKLMRYIQNNL